MIQDGPLTFALTLKRWFASNDWPQKITQDWAEDAGVQNPHGPWASQMCGAMKASGYNPKAEFFLALAEFNHFVDQQNTKVIVNSKLRDRLDGAKPLRLDNGQLYKAPDFWSLYAGLIKPPEAFTQSQELTQEDVDEWVRLMRNNFRKISLQYMCSRAEAWEMLKAKMLEIAAEEGGSSPPDDFDYVQEMLAGLVEPTIEDAIRRAKQNDGNQPLQNAMAELLGEKNSKKKKLTA